MPRAGLTRERVTEVASEIADAEGYDALTLAAVAERVGVRLPSLYKHVEGLSGLRREMAVRSKRELASVLAQATAGTSRRDALGALAAAYVAWARRRPGAYQASVVAPMPGDDDDLAASTEVTGIVFAALRGYALDEDAAIDAVRTLRALLHGFMTLELAGGFGLDRPVDDSLTWALDGLDAALADRA